MLGAIAFIWILGGGGACASRPKKERLTNNEITVFRYLTALGEKYRCYFTIETVRRSMGRVDLLVLSNAGPPSLDVLLQYLRSHVAPFVVVTNCANARIVHLVEQPLATNSMYLLERRATMSFLGNLPGRDGLLGSLGQRIGGVEQMFTISGAADQLQDHETRVSVQAVETEVRVLLAGALPLSQYNRVLWYASTRFDDYGAPWTYIQFYGKRGKGL